MGKIWRMSNDTRIHSTISRKIKKWVSLTFQHSYIKLSGYSCMYIRNEKRKKKIEIVFYGRNRVFRDPAKNMRITVSSRNLLWHDKTHRELLTCVEACILSSFSLAPSFSRVIWFHHGNGKYCTQFPLKLLSCNLIR